MTQNLATSQSEQAWTLAHNAVGSFFGTGSNHEKQKFEASLQLSVELPHKLICLKYQAKGMAGDIFHQEVSWLGRDLQGSLTLFVSSTNHKGITPHYFHRVEDAKTGPKKIFFRHGDPDDRLTFREEIAIGIFSNYNVEYVYAWGLAGGQFGPRSSALMKKII